MDLQTRRKWLTVCGSASVAALAGCTSSSDRDDSGDDATDEADSGTDDSPDGDSGVSSEIGADPQTDPASDEWLMTGVDLENTGYHPTASGPKSDVSERWVFETGDAIRSNAAVADGVVYINSRDGNTYAIDLETGDEMWVVDRRNLFHDTPTIYENKLIANNNGRMTVFDIESEEQLWNDENDVDPAGGPKVIDGVVYTGCREGYLRAVDPTDGTVLWDHEIGGGARNTIAISDGVVYMVGSPFYLYAINLESRERLWEVEIPEGTSTRGIAVDDNRIYVGTENENYVLCYDKNDGQKVWKKEVGGNVFSSVTIEDGSLYMRVEDSIVSLDASDGSVNWNIDDPGYRWNLVLANGVLYTPSDTGLSALDMNSGETMWKYETEESVVATPTVIDDAVIVGDRGGNVYALE